MTATALVVVRSPVIVARCRDAARWQMDELAKTSSRGRWSVGLRAVVRALPGRLDGAGGACVEFAPVILGACAVCG
jgi:hypothetical protein